MTSRKPTWRRPLPAVDFVAMEATLYRLERHMCRMVAHCERLMREKETLRVQNQYLSEEMDLLRADVDSAHRYIARIGERRGREAA